jgi:hypothetical protein
MAIYVVKHESVPVNLNGVMRDMCMTIKMNVDVDNFENETEKFRAQAAQLYDHKLFTVVTRSIPNDSYILSDKGELYIIQKILKPLYDAKSKNDLSVIHSYFKTDSEKLLLNQLFTGIIVQDPRRTLLNTSETILRLAMPAIKILDTIQKFSLH